MWEYIIEILLEVLPKVLVTFVVLAAAISTTVYRFEKNRGEVINFFKSEGFVVGLCSYSHDAYIYNATYDKSIRNNTSRSI